MVIDELPKPVLSVFTCRSSGTLTDLTTDEINLNSVDSKLVRTLLPFQKEGVRYQKMFLTKLYLVLLVTQNTNIRPYLPCTSEKDDFINI